MDADAESPSLTDEDSKRRFVGDALRTRREWDNLSPDERFDAVTGSANERLEDVGVTGTQYEMDSSLPSGNAATGFGYHQAADISLPEADFSAPDLTPDLVDTVYHESVHAEQSQIADQVRDNDILNPTDRQNDLYEDFHGANKGFHNLVQDDNSGNPNIYGAYRTQAAEQEAWGTGQSVADMFAHGVQVQDERAARRAELDAIDPLEGGLTLFDEQQPEREPEEQGQD